MQHLQWKLGFLPSLPRPLHEMHPHTWGIYQYTHPMRPLISVADIPGLIYFGAFGSSGSKRKHFTICDLIHTNSFQIFINLQKADNDIEWSLGVKFLNQTFRLLPRLAPAPLAPPISAGDWRLEETITQTHYSMVISIFNTSFIR